MTRPVVCHLSATHKVLDVRVVHRECRSLGEAGYDVRLIAPLFVPNPGLPLTIIPVDLPRNRLVRVRSRSLILREAAAVGASIYHLHSPELLPIVGALRRATGARIILDLHENYPDAFLSRRYVRPWNYPLFVRYYLRLERKYLPQVDLVITADPGTARRVAATGLTSRPPLVLYNYPLTMLESFAPHFAPPWRIKYLGGVDWTRGPWEMLELVERLLRGGREVLFDVLGPFESGQLEREYRRAIEARGLAGRVTVHGWVDPAAAGGLLIGGHFGLAMVNPRRCVCNIPSKVFDYMAAGLVPLVTRCEAMLEPMGGELAECLIDDNDPAEWHRRLARWMDAPQRCAALAMAGWRRAHAGRNWRAESRKLIATYADVGVPLA